MDNLILYDGLYQAEVNEFAYAEAELTVSHHNIENMFYDILDAIREPAYRLYGEADDSDDDAPKQSIFRKIGSMFKKFWRAIIDFIKKVFKKVLEILAKPFGFKMKKSENDSTAGSGGGSTTRTASPADTKIEKVGSSGYTALQELTEFRKVVTSYIKTHHNIEKSELLKEGYIVSNNTTEKISLDRLETLADVKSYMDEMEDDMDIIVDFFDKLANFDEKSSLEDLSKIQADVTGLLEEARIHKALSFKFEVAGKEAEVKKAVANVSAASVTLSNIITASRQVANLADELEKNKYNDTELASKLSSTMQTIMSNSIYDKIDSTVTGYIDDTCKVYGFPAKTAVGIAPVCFASSFGKTAIGNIIKEEEFAKLAEAIPEVKAYNDFKVENYSGNAEKIRGKILDDNFMKDAAKIVDIKPGYKLADIRLNLTGVSTFTKGYKAKQNILYKDIVLDVLRTSINHLTKIETEYNSNDDKKVNNRFKSIKDGTTSSSSATVKDMITGASQCLKSAIAQIAPLTNYTTRLDSVCVSAPYIYESIHIGNTMCILWDRVCYYKDFLEKQLKDNDKLNEDLGDDKAKIEASLKQLFKTFDTLMSGSLKEKY